MRGTTLVYTLSLRSMANGASIVQALFTAYGHAERLRYVYYQLKWVVVMR